MFYIYKYDLELCKKLISIAEDAKINIFYPKYYKSLQRAYERIEYEAGIEAAREAREQEDKDKWWRWWASQSDSNEPVTSAEVAPYEPQEVYVEESPLLGQPKRLEY